MRAANSRRLLLAVDALFGVLLIVAAFAGAVPRQPTSSESPRQPTPPEQVQRFGGLAPSGQTTGFAVARDGSLGIVDRGRNVVIHLDGAGQPLAEWGPHFGNGLDGQDLLGLAANTDGWWLLDRGALRILHLDPTGQAQPDRTIDLQPLATYGPTGLAVDASDNLYLADTGRDRLLVFDPHGQPINTIGASGSDLGNVKQPMGLAFAPDGAFFVADWENGRIERFDAAGQAIVAWPLPIHAWGLAVDSQGRVFAPDVDRKLVRTFGPDGQLLFQIGGDNPGPLPVNSPTQVAASPDGATLWVLGSDGLARVDLRPYASLRPSETATPIRWPLAILGAALLAVAAVAAWSPRRMPSWRRSSPRGQSPAPVPPVLAANAAATRTLPLPVVPARPALYGGATLFAVGGIGAIVATIRLTDPLTLADPWPRMALLAVSSLVWALGCALTLSASPLRWVAAWPLPYSPRTLSHPLLQRLAPLAAIIPAAAAALIWWTQRFQSPDATRGAVLWLLAILVAAAATALLCDWRRPSLSIWTLIPWLLFALALAPRIWDQANMPFGVWFDEAEAGLEARRFLAEGRYTPITNAYGRDASLFYYLISAASLAIKDPVVAGRTVAALVGAANAPLVYLLGRELWGWRIGLIAGVLLASSRWHLDVSRLGWDPISLPVCATLAFWLLARAVRSNRATDLVWAGMAFGLGLHGYIGFRGLPVVALVLLLYAAFIRRWSVPRALANIGITCAAATLVALPVIVFAIQDPAAFNGRLNQTLILAQGTSQQQMLDDIWSNVQKHALMFHVQGDGNGRHNIPGWPMLDPISGLLAILGLAWLVVRVFDWRAWLIFGWGIVAMSGGILTLPFEAPQAMRTVAMTPLLALLCALSLVLFADRVIALRSFAPRLTRPIAAVAGLVVAWIAVLNLTTFFGRQMQDPTVWESFSTRETIPARAAAASNGRFEAILGSPTIAPTVDSQLLAPDQRDRIRAFDPITDLPYRGTGPVLIVLETEHDQALADEVARYYPNAVRTPISAPNAARALVEQFTLEPNVLVERHGIDARYRAADGSSVERREPSADVSDLPVATPVEVAWRGGLTIDQPGSYTFQPPDGFTLDLDGTRLSNPVALTRGNHVFDLHGTATSAARLQLQWLPPGATGPRTVDQEALYVPPDGGNGLAATFYPTTTWEGAPREEVIDPIVAHYFHTNPFARVNIDPHGVWSAEWTGTLQAPVAGTYRFEAERISRAGLWIDDRLVFDDTPTDAPPIASGVAELVAGPHQVRVRFQERSEGGPRIYLYWTPPGGARQVIPGAVLSPPPPQMGQIGPLGQ